MQKSKLLFLLLIPFVLASCVIPTEVQTDDADNLVVGDVLVLEDGDLISGDLVAIGSSITLEEGASVVGEVTLIASTATIDGRVVGNVNGIAGATSLHSNAEIIGDFNQVFHQLTMDEESRIEGDINVIAHPESLAPALTGFNFFFPFISNPQRVLFTRIILVSLYTLFAVLITYLLPKPTKNLVGSIRNQPGISFGVGVLFNIAVPIICLVLVITICLSPIALILFFAYIIASLFGFIALANIVGEKINQWLYLNLSTLIKTLIGALILGIFASLLTLIPCIGYLGILTLSCYGIGGVVTSRFGRIEEKSRQQKTQSEPVEE